MCYLPSATDSTLVLLLTSRWSAADVTLAELLVHALVTLVAWRLGGEYAALVYMLGLVVYKAVRRTVEAVTHFSTFWPLECLK